MPAADFLTNVETAFLHLFAANDILKQYNWQRWDSDKEVKLPRGILGLRTRRDPEETPYHRVEVTIKFEGLPKRQKLSVVMNELKSLLQTINGSDLDTASGNTIRVIGKGINVGEDHPISAGLRTWTFTMALYILPMT